MRLQQIMLGMMLILSFATAQAGEARHYFAVSQENYSFTGLTGYSYRYGYDFSNMVSMEIDYSAVDLDAPTATILTADSVTNLMLNFNRRYESINLYFQIGGAVATLTQAAPAGETQHTGYSYGLGIELYGSRDTAITFSWMRRIQFEDGSSEENLDSVRVGIIHHFDFAHGHSRY